MQVVEVVENRGSSGPVDAEALRCGVPVCTEWTNWDRLEGLTRFASENSHTVNELALSWLASQPVVTSVIAGATSPDQVRGNVAATAAWSLSTDELAEVDRILSGEA